MKGFGWIQMIVLLLIMLMIAYIAANSFSGLISAVSGSYSGGI